MFSFLMKNRKAIEAAIKTLAFVVTVVVAAVTQILNHVEKEWSPASV